MAQFSFSSAAPHLCRYVDVRHCLKDICQGHFPKDDFSPPTIRASGNILRPQTVANNRAELNITIMIHSLHKSLQHQIWRLRFLKRLWQKKLNFRLPSKRKLVCVLSYFLVTRRKTNQWLRFTLKVQEPFLGTGLDFTNFCLRLKDIHVVEATTTRLWLGKYSHTKYVNKTYTKI